MRKNNPLVLTSVEDANRGLWFVGHSFLGVIVHFVEVAVVPQSSINVEASEQ